MAPDRQEKCDLYSMGVLFIAFVTGLMYTGKDCENDPKNKKDVEDRLAVWCGL